MKMTSKSGAAIAAAAATLFLRAPPCRHDLRAAKQVYRRNACKGQSSCKGGNHSCKGQNACKGQGLLRHDQGQVRRRQGQVRARLIRLPAE